MNTLNELLLSLFNNDLSKWNSIKTKLQKQFGRKYATFPGFNMAPHHFTIDDDLAYSVVSKVNKAKDIERTLKLQLILSTILTTPLIVLVSYLFLI